MIEKLLVLIIVAILVALLILVLSLLAVLIGESVVWIKCPKERQGYRCKHRPGECGR